MRDKYEKHGADVFETHQLVEMLLFHAQRQGDTNPAAHNLLSAHPDGAFGVSASCELCDAQGIGERSAELLRISSDTVLRLLCDRLSSEPMDSEFCRMAFLWLWFKNKPPKTAAALLLDDKNRYIDCIVMASGKTFRPEDYAEVLLNEMQKRKARSAVLCHNHKNNVKDASVEDVFITGYLKNALEADGRRLLGHYIVTDSDCTECCPVQ